MTGCLDRKQNPPLLAITGHETDLRFHLKLDKIDSFVTLFHRGRYFQGDAGIGSRADEDFLLRGDFTFEIRDPLAGLDQCGLPIEGHDAGPGENFPPPGFRQRLNGRIELPRVDVQHAGKQIHALIQFGGLIG